MDSLCILNPIRVHVFVMLRTLTPRKPTRYEYHWADGTTVKKPIKCSAPKYIDYLMTWVQEQLDDENIFPSKIGMVFYLLYLFKMFTHECNY